MPSVMDKVSDWFCTKKGVARKKELDVIVAKRKKARRELDKVIADLTHSRSISSWPSSQRSRNTGR